MFCGVRFPTAHKAQKAGAIVGRIKYLLVMFSLQKLAEMAKKTTQHAADIKPWRVRTKAARAMYARAQELAVGRGYMIATDAEIFAQFREFCPVLKWAAVRDDKKRIWGIMANIERDGRALFNVVCM